MEGSGGNIAVLTGPDGKKLIDVGIGVSRPQITKALADLGPDPITHLINTHWHFDHANGNEWLHSVGVEFTNGDQSGVRLRKGDARGGPAASVKIKDLTVESRCFESLESKLTNSNAGHWQLEHCVSMPSGAMPATLIG